MYYQKSVLKKQFKMYFELNCFYTHIQVHAYINISVLTLMTHCWQTDDVSAIIGNSNPSKLPLGPGILKIKMWLTATVLWTHNQYTYNDYLSMYLSYSSNLWFSIIDHKWVKIYPIKQLNIGINKAFAFSVLLYSIFLTIWL